MAPTWRSVWPVMMRNTSVRARRWETSRATMLSPILSAAARAAAIVRSIECCSAGTAVLSLRSLRSQVMQGRKYSRGLGALFSEAAVDGVPDQQAEDYRHCNDDDPLQHGQQERST